MNRMRIGAAAIGLVAILLITVGTAGAAKQRREAREQRPARVNTVIMFAADGMRPDLVQKYADAKVMPTMRKLIKTGAQGRERPAPGLPAQHRRGLVTRWPRARGRASTARPTTPSTASARGNFNNRTSFATNGILQADTLAQAAERAGKKVVSMEWVGARNLRACPAGAGGRLPDLLLEPRRPAELRPCPGSPRCANTFGVSYQRVDLDAACRLDQRSGLLQPGEAGDADRRRTRRSRRRTTSTRTYDLYIYDSTNNGVTSYDRVLSRALDGRQGRLAEGVPT